ESGRNVSLAMNDLRSRNDQIGGITEAISSIADQTNLLALNAAIEAARAGEHGRGFAIVADEVRKLAEESQNAAASIGSLVREIQSQTDHTVALIDTSYERTASGMTLAAVTRDVFTRIEGAVEDMSVRVSAISEATSDAASIATGSASAAEQVSAAAEQTCASMQEISASSTELESLAQRLADTTRQFQLTKSGSHDELTADIRSAMNVA
ncbi:MAG: methyl-accepting chemotaxis protein, partial [Thermoleophilia bacterium]|nr:methyl-accepting chemotaxis protein [Thermoleophilia bacterium]